MDDGYWSLVYPLMGIIVLMFVGYLAVKVGVFDLMFD